MPPTPVRPTRSPAGASPPTAASWASRVAPEDRLPFAALVEVCNRTDAPRRTPEGFRLVDAFGDTYVRARRPRIRLDV